MPEEKIFVSWEFISTYPNFFHLRLSDSFFFLWAAKYYQRREQLEDRNKHRVQRKLWNHGWFPACIPESKLKSSRGGEGLREGGGAGARSPCLVAEAREDFACHWAQSYCRRNGRALEGMFLQQHGYFNDVMHTSRGVWVWEYVARSCWTRSSSRYRQTELERKVLSPSQPLMPGSVPGTSGIES